MSDRREQLIALLRRNVLVNSALMQLSEKLRRVLFDFLKSEESLAQRAKRFRVTKACLRSLQERAFRNLEEALYDPSPTDPPPPVREE